jgi:hypothetical protein
MSVIKMAQSFGCGKPSLQFLYAFLLAFSYLYGTMLAMNLQTGMTLKQFAAAVNTLSRANCARINAEIPARLFPAIHRDFPDKMLCVYFDYNITPETCYADLCNETTDLFD